MLQTQSWDSSMIFVVRPSGSPASPPTQTPKARIFGDAPGRIHVLLRVHLSPVEHHPRASETRPLGNRLYPVAVVGWLRWIETGASYAACRVPWTTSRLHTPNAGTAKRSVHAPASLTGVTKPFDDSLEGLRFSILRTTKQLY